MGIAAGIPFVGRSTANAMTWLPRSASRQLDAATARAEGAANANNLRDFNIAAGEINNAMGRVLSRCLTSRRRGLRQGRRQERGSIRYHRPAGGGLVAEANMFPYQWDALNLPPGPAQREAREQRTRCVAYGESGLMGSMSRSLWPQSRQISLPVHCAASRIGRAPKRLPRTRLPEAAAWWSRGRQSSIACGAQSQSKPGRSARRLGSTYRTYCSWCNVLRFSRRPE